MQPIDDGGPAFPCDVEYIPSGPPGSIICSEFRKHPGMSLRDYFAAKAMQARIIAAFSCWDQDAKDQRAELGSKMQDITALAAYTYADAMLAARQHKE